jgi:hypothetical protein
MANLPQNFKWQESSPHLDLLDKFAKPRDINQVLSWQYVSQTIGESTKAAIDRFIRDGAIVYSTLDETLECIFQVAQLKKLLQERGPKVTGSKHDLVDRLIAADHDGMHKIAQKAKVMKCSEMALELLTEFEKRKQIAFDAAKKESFNALRSNDAKSAYRIYANYQKLYNAPNFEASSYQVEEIMYVLKSKPKVLAHVSNDNLILLRAIAGMHLLWRDESIASLASSNNMSGLKNDRVAINYILTHARIAEDLEREKEYAKQVRIEFDAGDIDSCELCQALNGKVFDIDKVPELPMIGCTSETGCKCRIETIFDESDEASFSIHIADEEDDDDDIESASIAKLRQLKQMLDEDLITKEEYEKKREEILSRF